MWGSQDLAGWELSGIRDLSTGPKGRYFIFKTMNLNKLTRRQKTKMFVIGDRQHFFAGGMINRDLEIEEYIKLGLPAPLYAMYGKYIPGKAYTVDPLADSIGEMQSRIIIW